MYKGPDGQIFHKRMHQWQLADHIKYKDYYNKQKLGDGGRVGLFMGGPPLEGTALSIYNSMSSYGFSDQATNALLSKVYIRPRIVDPETTM